MLKNIKIQTIISAGFAFILILVTMINVPMIISTISDVVEEAEKRELASLFKSAKTELKSQGYLAVALSSLVANVDYFAEMFANNERDALNHALQPTFKAMREKFYARQFQFHTPPATSFLRLHKPAKFGDDLSSFRSTVVATNNEKKNIMGLEKGVAGLGIRGISPVYHKGKHYGSVEFGMSFGQPFFNQFKQKYGVDISLHLKTQNGFDLFASTIKDGELLSKNQLDMALNKQAVIKQLNHNKMKLAVFANRINDYSGKAVGVIVIAMDRSHYSSAINNATTIALTLGGISLIAGLIFATIIARMIVVPLNKAVSAMDDIAQGDGDLTKRLDDSGSNEISSLAAAFNQFAEKVRLMVGHVSASTIQLASAAEQMSAITDETSCGVNQQQSETNQVVTAMHQMTATVQEVARNATDAAGAATNADSASSEGREVVIRTMKTIESLSSELNSAESVISQLEQDSENIGTVLDVIKSIAEQTNLLALNAAIEAARAGEQGRGFAVVADEVRTLASRTQQSTQEIQTMIEKLQDGTKSAVSVMNNSRNHADSSVNQAAQAGSSLESITEAVANIRDMNTQIATAAEQQSAVADEINKNIINISTIVDKTAEGATQTSIASEELAKLSNQLQSLVGQFKV